MPFPATLSAPNKVTIRAGNYSATPYVLVNPNDIVFSAQVNQTVFGVTFASVTFDNITAGAILDVFDGFTVYIGDTTDIRKATYVGRARGDGAAGTTLNINETSAAIENDQFITVVKDVAIREKLGRYVNNVMKVDWDITFRQLKPRVTGLKSCYVGILAGGLVEFTFPAVGAVTTAGAAISSWLWDADGGAFVNGTVSTDAQPDIRYTVAGVYWPRVTVTDDGGRTEWFTTPIFVCSADLSDSFIKKGVEGIAITASINNGYQMNFSYYSQEMESTADQAFTALWLVDDYNGSATPILDDIAFIGRLRRETTGHTVNENYGKLPDTPFVCDGVLTQMGRLRSPQAAMVQDATPTEFGEIATMTQWRAASYILSEFSTVVNVSSVVFDVEDNTYRNKQDSTDDNSLLVSINNLLSALNSRLNLAAQGELYAAHNANFQSDAARNALDIITTFTSNDTFNQKITREHVETVGRITAFAGGYNTTDGKLRVLRATAPAVASGEGQQIGTVNGILLDNDQSLDDQKTEIEQIAADTLANRNPKDNVQLDILDGYWFLSPANFQWYKYIGTITENNRDIVYDTNDRFLLTSITKRFNNALGSWDQVAIALTHETQGTDAQVISQVAPGAVPTPLPALPSLPAYPSFPALDSLYLPTGATPEDTPPISQSDGEIIASPTDPFSAENKGDGNESTETAVGNVAVIWNIATAFMATNLGMPEEPNWRTVYNTSGINIKDFKFVRSLDKSYILENGGTDDSNVWKTNNITESVVNWTSQAGVLDDIEATLIRPAGNTGVIYYGQYGGMPAGAFTLNLLDGDGQGTLVGSSLAPTHAGTVSNFVGTYDDGNDRFDGGVGSNAGMANNIQWPIPPGVTITDVFFDCTWWNNWIPDPGERWASIEIFKNGVSQFRQDQALITGVAKPQAGGVTVSIPGAISKKGDTLLLHCSVEDDLHVYLRITDVQIKGIATADFAATRFSDDSGVTFDDAIGVEEMAAGDGSFDCRNAVRVLAAADDDVYRAATAGTAYTTVADQGNTAGQFAKAIWLFGDGSGDDYLLAPDGGGTGLYKIINNVRTDITPNDGAADGVVLGPNSICMSRADDNYIWAVMLFGAVVKLAYTVDQGDNWLFSAQALTADAIHIRVKDTRTDIVMIAQNTVLHYSQNGGVTFTQKITPQTLIIGVEVK